MSPEAVPTVSAPVASSLVEIGTPQTFSGIPAPEIPSSIITEISRPAGLTEAEFLPPSIEGNFEIGDIIKPHVEESISQTHIEPAVFLDPKIVAEINRIPEPKKREAPPLFQTADEPKVGIHQPIEVNLAPDVEVKRKIKVKPEISNEIVETPHIPEIKTELFPQSSKETHKITTPEQNANSQAIAEAISVLNTLSFTQAEQQAWEQKLRKIASEINNSIQTEAQTSTQEDILTITELETHPELGTHVATLIKETPIPKKAEEENRDIEFEVQAETLEPLWDLYLITHIYSKEITVDEETSDEEIEPAVVESSDVIEPEIDQSLKEIDTKVKYIGRFRERELKSEIQKLAAEGAENIIWENGRNYKGVPKLNLTEPEELTKVA